MTQTPKVRFRRRLWLGYWLLLFVATHTPGDHVPRVQRKHVDKVAHFALYFGLSVLAARYVAVTRAEGVVRRISVWAAVFLGYAAFDEWLQQFTYRSMDFWDWVADAGGVATGTLIAAVVLRFRTGARG